MSFLRCLFALLGGRRYERRSASISYYRGRGQ